MRQLINQPFQKGSLMTIRKSLYALLLLPSFALSMNTDGQDEVIKTNDKKYLFMCAQPPLNFCQQPPLNFDTQVTYIAFMKLYAHTR